MYAVHIENMNVSLETIIGNILGCVYVPAAGQQPPVMCAIMNSHLLLENESIQTYSLSVLVFIDG